MNDFEDAAPAREVSPDVAAFLDPLSGEELVKYFQDPDPAVRREITRLPQITPETLTAMASYDPDPTVRAEAILHLPEHQQERLLGDLYASAAQAAELGLSEDQLLVDHSQFEQGVEQPEIDLRDLGIFLDDGGLNL